MMVAGIKKGEMRRGPCLQIVVVFPLDHFESADAAADINADSFGIFFGYLKAGGRQGILGGRNRHLNEAAHLLDFFFLDEFRGIEVLDLTRNLAIEQGGIESFNAGNAAADFKQRLPGLFRGVADRGQKTYARNYDSAGNNRSPSWIAHAAASHQGGTKEISVAANGRHATLHQMPQADSGMPRRRLLLLIFDVGDGVADRGDLFGVFVGDLQFESFFEGHDEFHDVQ